MNRKTGLLWLSLILAINGVWFVGCGSGDDVAGGVVETGNAFVSGQICNPDGTPAANATVRLIPASQDPKGNPENLVIISTKTNNNGFYAIDAQLNGKYNVFGSDNQGNKSFRNAVPLNGDSVVIGRDTLHQVGGLHMTFKIQPQHNPANIDVIFWGTDLFLIPVDSNGSAGLANLAAGIYGVRIKLGLDYAVIDTHFVVQAGKTTEIGPIELKYLSIPIVTGVAAVFDTARQCVRIKWNRIDTGMVAGYNIYRGVLGKTFNDSPINSTIVVDTTFSDTGFMVNETYVYRIKALNKNSDVGNSFSVADTVSTAPRNLIETHYEWSFLDTVRIRDTVSYVVKYHNPTRPIRSVRWFINDSVLPMHALSDTLTSGSDTIQYAWTLPGSNKVAVQAQDDAGMVWADTAAVQVILDNPAVSAGNDTVVFTSNKVTLSGRATVHFGSIVRYEWKIGVTGSATVTMDGRYEFNVPDNGNWNIPCILTAVNDIGNEARDTLRVHVIDPVLNPMGMKYISAGSFVDGAGYTVHITKDYFMDSTVVTQAQYQTLMGANPSFYLSSDRPVEHVSFYETILYCNARSKSSGLDTVYTYAGNDFGVLNGLGCDWDRSGFRLPTEDEWEYACRARTSTPFYWGISTDTATVNLYAWWKGNNVSNGTKVVAQKLPNAFSLYDMVGNVQAWCWDAYNSINIDTTRVDGRTDNKGPAQGNSRVIRGSNYKAQADSLRSSNRTCIVPTARSEIGFRTVLQVR